MFSSWLHRLGTTITSKSGTVRVAEVASILASLCLAVAALHLARVGTGRVERYEDELRGLRAQLKERVFEDADPARLERLEEVEKADAEVEAQEELGAARQEAVLSLAVSIPTLI